MKKTVILFIIWTFGFQLGNAQSPWTREKGKAYVQLGLTSLSYDAVQFNGEKIENIGDYSDVTIQIYSEYGITSKLEAQLILPYKLANYKDEGISESISGIGNVTLGLKYKISDKNWKISSGLLFSANSIKKEATLEVSSTGINASTFLPYISIGTNYNKWYYFGNIGYAYMDNDYSDYLKATIEIGYNLIPKGHLILVLDTRNPVTKEDAYFNDNIQWTSHLDRQAYNAFGIKTNYEFIQDKFGANFSVFGAFGIDNAPLAPTINIGVYTKL